MKRPPNIPMDITSGSMAYWRKEHPIPEGWEAVEDLGNKPTTRILDLAYFVIRKK